MKEKNRHTTLEEHLTKRYGRRGTEKRTEFDIKAKAFMIGVFISEEMRLAGLTKQQLAERKGVNRSIITRMEKGQTDF